MKKIIAIAITGAFVAPVMAAEVNLSGSMTYNYITSNKATTDDKVASDDTTLSVVATEELANGMSVKGTINVVNDDATSKDLDMQGSNLSISGEFGQLIVGDTSGASDATGDWTDVSPVFGGFDADGIDANLAYTLPSVIEGLTLRASSSPKGVNSAGDADFSTEGLGGNSYSVTYSTGGLSVYVANDTFDAAAGQETDRDVYGVKYATGPFMVAYESASANNATVTASSLIAHATVVTNKNVDYSALAGTYKMADTTIGFEMQEIQEDGASKTTRQDETTLFVSHSLGGGVTVYAATSEDKGGPADTAVEQSAVGVKFAF